MLIKSAASVCSGIGSAPYALNSIDFKWFSEIETFQSNVLKHHFPKIPNIGDMVRAPELLIQGELETVDLLCGGTPCQSFSLAGLKEGLNDERGNLTLEFLKIAEQNDEIRLRNGDKRSFVLWENVQGIFSDKTNAFGIFLSGLAGYEEEINNINLDRTGFIKGPKRNVAWRVLDSKFFGIPQQRKRVFVLASDKSYHPENILFENKNKVVDDYPSSKLNFTKENINYEIFREYTDTLYSAYGTKWNGNSAAYNGSLFIVEDSRLRRFMPLECERLMGFPDNYTNIKGASRTKRYQSLGNSWSVPVVEWIGNRLLSYNPKSEAIQLDRINTSEQPNDIKIGHLSDIVTSCDVKNLFLSPVAAAGILRRKNERDMSMNFQLEKYLIATRRKMSKEEIEKKSRVQKRGAFSQKK